MEEEKKGSVPTHFYLSVCQFYDRTFTLLLYGFLHNETARYNDHPCSYNVWGKIESRCV